MESPNEEARIATKLNRLRNGLMVLLDIITLWKNRGLVVSLLLLEDSVDVISPSILTVTLSSSTD